MVGTGGVGKTSLSLTLAIKAAQEGKRVAALTIDPSQRLSRILNFKSTKESIEQTQSQKIYENLDIFHVDTKKSFLDFVSSHVTPSHMKKLKENKIFNQISQNLRETHHFASLNEMVRIVESGKYDLIVLDTPPSDQVVDFFESPGRLLRFFSPREASQKQEWFEWVKERSMKLVEKVLSQLVGNELVTEIDLFFSAIEQIRQEIQKISTRFIEIIKDEGTKTILVYSSAKDKIAEAQFLQNEMNRNNISIDSFVMNRAYYPALDQSKGDLIETDSREEELYNYFSQQKIKSAEIVKSMKKKSTIENQNFILIPEINVRLSALEDVLEFAQQMSESWTEVK